MLYVTSLQRPHLGGNIDGGDPRTYYPSMWAWLVNHFRIRSVYDVGCGQGHALACFQQLGCQITGLDGLPQQWVPTGGSFLVHDLTAGPMILPGVDLVWCCEVVEHVAADHLDSLLDTITCGRVLAMTHAVPEQGGWHHVNCQTADYWMRHIEARGMVLDTAATFHSRKLAAGYWAETGMIFVKP